MKYKITFPERIVREVIVEVEDDNIDVIRELITIGEYEEVDILEQDPIDYEDWYITDLKTNKKNLLE